MDVRFYPYQTMSPRMLTESFTLGFNLRLPGGGNVYSRFVSANVTVYDSTGAVTAVNAAPMNVDSSNVTSIRCTYMLYTGTGRPISTADTYRIVFQAKMADNSTNQTEVYMILNPTPY